MYPFSDGSFAPLNAWYVAAFTNELNRDILSRWIVGEPVVMFRKEDGTAVALAGNCPHRHFPLGAGELIGDTLRCTYHGLTFAADGACIHVPSLVSVPSSYRVRSYPLVERGMWAWIWPGDPALADETLIPTMEEIGYGEAGWFARPFHRFDVKARFQLLNDNLLDLSHLANLHASSIGTESSATTPEQRDTTPRRLRSRRNIMGSEQPPVQRNPHSTYDGLIDRTTQMDFFAPGFHAGIDDTFVASDHPTRANEILKRRKVWHGVTPSTRHESMYFFSMGVEQEFELDIITKAILPVLEEDVYAAEQIELMFSRLAKIPPELLLKSDITAGRGRAIVQKMIDAERTSA